MRRFLFFALLAIILVFSLPLYAAADEAGITEEEALERAKAIIPQSFLEKEEDFEIEIYDEEGSDLPAHWAIYWSDRSSDSYFEIAINAKDGSLTYFLLNVDEETLVVPKRLLTRQEAQEIAYGFACRQQPHKMRGAALNNHYLYMDTELNRKYSFAWEGSVGGIPVVDNFIGVEVDAASGMVTGFVCSWQDVPPASSAAPMDIEEFTQKVLDNADIVPFYYALPSTDGVKAALTYTLGCPWGQYFDALTGEPVDLRGNKVSWEEVTLFSGSVPKNDPQQQTALSGYGRKISFEEGKTIAGDFFEKMGLRGIMDEGMISQNIQNGRTEELWSFGLDQTIEEGEDWSLVSVVIKAANGRIMGYSRDYFDFSEFSEERESPPPKDISFDKALKTAREFLSIIGIQENNYVLVPQAATDYSSAADVYRFMWYRLVNGVPTDDIMAMEVSRSRGIVTFFAEAASPFTSFESTEGIISKAEAEAAVKEAKPFQLAYLVPLSEEGNSAPALVYRESYFGETVDAHSGEVIQSHCWVEEMDAYYEQLQNNWAEAPLTLLSETGMLPLPQDLEPNQTVKRREALRIMELVTAEDYPQPDDHSPFLDVAESDPDLLAIIHAVKNGIIKSGGNLNPDAPLTREELAVWVINAMGYKEVAESPVSMNVKSKDASKISKNKINHVALAQAYKLMNNDGKGNFRPQDPVTWGELATTIIRAFPKFDINYGLGL